MNALHCQIRTKSLGHLVIAPRKRSCLKSRKPRSMAALSSASACAQSSALASPSSSPVASCSVIPSASSRLRDRAGIPTYLDKWDHSSSAISNETEFDRLDSLEESPPSNPLNPLRPWTPRNRTQAERARMSHRERTIALDLLQDLPIPPNEWFHATGEQDGSDERELQAIISKKDLVRKRPVARSAEEIRVEDLIKELTDEKIGIIDNLESDHALLDWVENHVFKSSNPTSEGTSAGHSLPDDDMPRLGAVFDTEGITVNVDGFVQFSSEMDPIILSSHPLCLTPLSSPILLHVLRTFSQTFHNPHLALELFERIRRHPKPLARYLGLTKEVFLEVMKIRWMCLHDLVGVHDHLVDMKLLGIEVDDEIRALISKITRVVVTDEMNAERLATLDARQESEGGVASRVSESMLQRRRRFFDAERWAVSMMESVVAESLEDQRKTFRNRFKDGPA